MATEITLNSVRTNRNLNTYWGIIEDTMLDEARPTFNFGAGTLFEVGRYGGSGNRNEALLRIEMPPAPNDAGRIISIRLYLHRYGTNPLTPGAGDRILGLYPFTASNRWIEGSGGNAGALDRRGCSWNERMRGANWNRPIEDATNLISTYRITTAGSDVWEYWDMTKSGITWGSVGDYILQRISGTDVDDRFHSRQSTVGNMPYLEIKYLKTQTETPEQEEAFLSFEPNPANLEQVLLKWKRPKNQDLKIADGTNEGAYVLIKHTSTIQDHDTGTLVARLSSELECVDDLVGSAYDGTPYYYRLLICDESNYILGTRTGSSDGTTTSTSVDHLVDSGATFQADGVQVGDRVHNTTDDTWTNVAVVGSETDLTLDADIMVSGENYSVFPGVIGSPLFTNEVVIEKPKVSSFVESGADYIWDVWEEHIIDTVCQTPVLDNVQNEAYQHDWQGDGSETGWKELETPSNTDSTPYRYTSYGVGHVLPKVRVRNSLGFWSAQYPLTARSSGTTTATVMYHLIDSGATFVTDGIAVGDYVHNTTDDTWGKVTAINSQIDLGLDVDLMVSGEDYIIEVIALTALTALAECRASPKKVSPSEGFRIRGDESQDRNADGTITKYEFQLQRDSDSKYWTGAAWQAGSYWKDQTTTPYWDIIAGAVDHTANVTYTCRCRVTGLKGVASTPAIDTVEGIIETPVDIRTGLSSNVIIELSSMMRDAIVTKRTKLEGTTSIRIFEGLKAENRTLEGVSRRADWLDDLLILDGWQENQTLLKYFYDEPTNVRYITFRITGKQERRRDQYRAAWSIRIDVESKTT